MFKIIGATLLFLGIIVTIAVVDDLTPFWFHKTEKKIEVLWQQDVETLIRENKFPKEWLEISSVQVDGLSESANQLLQQIQVPIRTKETGGFKLEITVDSWIESNVQVAVIEYHLINIKSKNLVWELGRTLQTEIK